MDFFFLLPSPELNFNTQDYHSLHLLTMMFYKPIVSLVAGLAVVGSAAAATTPVARGDGGYPPPTVTPINQCNTGPVQCCNTYTSTSNPVTSLLAGPLGLGGLLDPALGVGISCLALIGGNQW